jgi:hypothetical protein
MVKQTLDGFIFLMTLVVMFAFVIGVIWILGKVAGVIVDSIGWTPLLITFGVLAFIAFCHDLGADPDDWY